MKKLLKFIRSALVFLGWTALFSVFANLIIKLIWNFNFMDVRSWNVLSSFWNQGGVIKTTSDVLLLTTLFLLPLLWLTGFVLVLKLNYTSVLLWPFKIILSPFKSKTPAEPERVVLKNIKNSEQLAEEIKSEIESLKPEKSKEAGNIRSTITKKLTEEIKSE